MVNAFARCLTLSPQELVDQLGHDGLGMFEGTTIQRTHHVQEILDVASDMGVWFTPVELVPQSFDPKTKQAFPIHFGDMSGNFERFQAYLKTSKGVIQGMMRGQGHAVYWNGHECFDNRGNWSLWREDNEFLPGVYWRALWTT